MQNLAKLEPTQEGKTVVFFSPLEKKGTFVRTGTIIDPYSPNILHAILYGHSKEYAKMDIFAKKKLAQKILDSVKDKIDLKKWEENSYTLVSKIPFQDNVKAGIKYFYQKIEGKTMEKKPNKTLEKIIVDNLEVFGIISEIMPQKVIEEILAKIYEEKSDDSIKECIIEIVESTEKFIENKLKVFGDELPKKKREFCIKKFSEFITSLLNFSEEIAFKEYIKNNKDYSSFDISSINILAEKVNRNIYFLDSRTRLPYKTKMNYKNGRKSLIVLWLGGQNYEIVGKLLSHNRVQREFSPEDDIIQKIYGILYDHKRIKKDYPELAKYIRKDSHDEFEEKSHEKSHEKSDDEKSENSTESSEESSDEKNSSQDEERNHRENREKRKYKNHKNRSENREKRKKYAKSRSKSSDSLSF